jgi:cytochrome bd-type quinol oxidase subunit 1
MQLLLARWEFSAVTVFHFFFVPLTIGLAFLVALMQTLAYKRGDASAAFSGACSLSRWQWA